MKTQAWFPASLLLLAAILPAWAGAPATPPEECVLFGESAAIPNPDDPSLGAWTYCFTIQWFTSTLQPPDHLNVVLNLGDCPCVCELFPFAAADPAGSSSGVDPNGLPCTALYHAGFECAGDPSMGIEEPLVQFVPYGGGCVPRPTGPGTFCFYSDWPPIPVPVDNLLISIKAGDEECYGELLGVLPECTCPPTPVESRTWGGIKRFFGE